MTRFARAKGSKASNEKAPEDSTPWEVMKEQLLQAKKEKEESKNRQEAEQQRIQNYENFLKEQKVQKRKATWCDFPEVQKQNPNLLKAGKKKKQNKQVITVSETAPTQTVNQVANAEVDEAPPKKKKKKNKTKSGENNIHEQDTNINIKTGEDVSSPKKNKKKNKKKGNNDVAQQEGNNNSSDAIDNQERRSKKNENKPPLEEAHGTPEVNIHQPVNSLSVQHNAKNNSKSSKKKKDKLVNGKVQRRKDVNDKSFQLIINGKEVELVRVDGFPVMKKDAERLTELRKNMIQKGIPKSEIQRTMKLERRRAEKALARVRKEVCYNCRKGGHNLSDCPDLKTKIPGVVAGEGICFKCGSTEHRQFECKVQRDKEFRFATCFICKEPGHIARQCPDNPKGLYPNGGSCNICGDVTHLRKDCPTASDKKEEKSIKLSTLDSTDHVEGISHEHKKVNNDEPAKKVKKIKF